MALSRYVERFKVEPYAIGGPGTTLEPSGPDVVHGGLLLEARLQFVPIVNNTGATFNQYDLAAIADDATDWSALIGSASQRAPLIATSATNRDSGIFVILAQQLKDGENGWGIIHGRTWANVSSNETTPTQVAQYASLFGQAGRAYLAATSSTGVPAGALALAIHLGAAFTPSATHAVTAVDVYFDGLGRLGTV